MTGPKYTKDDVGWRLEDCAKYDYDPEELADLWEISEKGAASFMRHNCPDEYFRAQTFRNYRADARKDKPEYENQWLFDLYVLTQEEYMAKYKLSRNAYTIKLCRARKDHEIYTPKQRARWERENDLVV